MSTSFSSIAASVKLVVFLRACLAIMHAFPKLVLRTFLFAITVPVNASTNSSLQLARISNGSVKATPETTRLTSEPSKNTRMNMTNSSSSHFVDTENTNTFYIWPKDGIGSSGNKNILDNIKLFAGLSLDDIMISQFGSDLSDVNFFTANMTESAAYSVSNTTEACIGK